MPLIVFACKRIPALRRDRVEAAVFAGGRHQSGIFEAWISTDPLRGDIRVIITGPHGFERRVSFAIDEEPIAFSGNSVSREQSLKAVWKGSVRDCAAGVTVSASDRRWVMES
jgi:hypothetical protein